MRILRFNEMRELPLGSITAGLETVTYTVESGEGLEWAPDHIQKIVSKLRGKTGKITDFKELKEITGCEWKRKTEEQEGVKPEDIKPNLMCYIPEITPPIIVLKTT
jgi:hypothetical protein